MSFVSSCYFGSLGCSTPQVGSLECGNELKTLVLKKLHSQCYVWQPPVSSGNKNQTVPVLDAEVFKCHSSFEVIDIFLFSPEGLDSVLSPGHSYASRSKGLI